MILRRILDATKNKYLDSYLSHHITWAAATAMDCLFSWATSNDENTSFYKPEKGREAQQHFIYLRKTPSSVIQTYLLILLSSTCLWSVLEGSKSLYKKIIILKTSKNNIREEPIKNSRDDLINFASLKWKLVKNKIEVMNHDIKINLMWFEYAKKLVEKVWWPEGNFIKSLKSS